MKKKWIWLLLPAALLLLILLHVHSLARLAPSEIGRQVPVLMYHAVGDDCWGEEHLFDRPAELEQQLQYLSENGYETIFFEDLAHLERYEKPVILTFDDGYDDNYTLLLPLLQKYHMKGHQAQAFSVIVCTNGVSCPNISSRQRRSPASKSAE